MKKRNFRNNLNESDDDDDLNDSDIFSLFAADKEKARDAQEKINRNQKQKEKKKKDEMRKQQIRDFEENKEMLKKQGIYQPNPNFRNNQNSSNSKGKVYMPPLPPPPPSVYEELNRKHSSDESDNENLENPFENKIYKEPPPLQPEMKKFVGEQYGINVDVPKQPLPTRFVQGVPYGAQKMSQYQSQQYQNATTTTPYGYPQYNYNGQIYPQIPQEYQAYFPHPYPGMVPSYDPSLMYNQGATVPPGFPGIFQPPIPKGPFTPNPSDSTNYNQQPPYTEAVAKQRLMEESGISIAPPTSHYDYMSKMTPQQKLVYSSGIHIEPRLSNYGQAQLKAGDHTYNTTYQSTRLPATVQTSLGPIHIGRQGMKQNDEQNPKQYELKKPVKEGLDLKVGGQPLVIGKQQDQQESPAKLSEFNISVEIPQTNTNQEGTNLSQETNN